MRQAKGRSDRKVILPRPDPCQPHRPPTGPGWCAVSPISGCGVHTTRPPRQRRTQLTDMDQALMDSLAKQRESRREAPRNAHACCLFPSQRQSQKFLEGIVIVQCQLVFEALLEPPRAFGKEGRR